MSDLTVTARLHMGQRAAVEVLRRACEAHDGCEHPIELNEDRVPPGGTAVHFLWQQHDQLIGYLELSPDEPPEAVAIVHPEFRRRGIGRHLETAAQEEARRRGSDALVLTVPGASVAGQAFARALGAEPDFSEYRMELDPAPLPLPAPAAQEVTLQQVGAEALEILVQISCAAFDREPERERLRFSEWLEMPNQRLFLGYREGEPVGSIRVGRYDGATYLQTFGVLPQYQGQGLGGQILRAVVRFLVAEGAGPIRLEVDLENPAALSLYTRCGFRILDSFQYYRLAL